MHVLATTIQSRGHELGSKAQLPVGAEDGEGGYVAVTLGGLFFHLGEHVTDDLSAVILSDVEEMGPREDVVEIVFIW
ncbi:hypothetical protein R6Q59_027942 [Mikania micrantha]